MGVVSSQGLSYRLVANGLQLDLFKDEEIKVSDNITGLFDIGTLPADFTRQITLPGTKRNNAFFQHVYDISVDSPFLFSTNQKVSAYFDFGGLYVSNGYLQLNKVNVIANKFIDSYEVSVYGLLSSFARDINRVYLTELSSLQQYNHTASLDNITASWSGSLFDGDIVYPLAEYGQNLRFTGGPTTTFGMNTVSGSLTVQDFKPAIRVKKVWDAIFEEFGYTYSSSFMNQGWLDDVYMIANTALKYPEFEEVDLETFGQIKIGPISGSGTNVLLTAGVSQPLTWYNIISDPQNSIPDGANYNLVVSSSLDCVFNLEARVSGTVGVPQFDLEFYNNTTSTTFSVPLTTFNTYFVEFDSLNTSTGNQVVTLQTQVVTPVLTPGNYNFKLKYSNYNGSSFTVTVAPDDKVASYLQIKKVKQGGDYRVMDMTLNMPYGTQGIKCVDFIKGIQKKFNLIMYPSKTKLNEFIIESWNTWYKQGEVKNFNKYINLNEKIEVIPANNLAVNKLEFGDKLDNDYIGQQFSKLENRQFGKTYYTDTNNFFSQGEFKVETTFGVGPLKYVDGTGVSGSAGLPTGSAIQVAYSSTNNYYDVCVNQEYTKYSANGFTFLETGDTLYNDLYLQSPLTGYKYVADTAGEIYNINQFTGVVGGYADNCVNEGPS